MTALVLLAHGSPDPRSGAAVRTAARDVGRLLGRQVAAAFLDHDAPRLADVVADGDAVVLPLLLSTAFHARVDVPAAAAGLGNRVELLDPLGHPHHVLDAQLLTASVAAAAPVLVVAAGTRIDEERQAFSAAVDAASRRTGVAVSTAFATGPGPGVAQGLAGLPPDAVVLPWLLAPGRLLDAVVAAAAGRRVAGHGLLAERAVVLEIARRLRRTGHAGSADAERAAG